MKDGPALKTVKRISLAVFTVRLWLHRAYARRAGEIRYELGGACRRCAACCEAPGIQVGRLTWYLPLLRKLFLLWHRRVNGFELSEIRPADRVFVFRCTHFDWETRSCDSYESRPGMCRDYPRLQLERAAPEFLEGCGYKALAIDRARLVEELEARSLSPDQLAKLKQELYLDE